MANLFEATAPLRAHPWFGHAFGAAGLLLALWLRFGIGEDLVGYPFITFLPVVVLTAFLGGAVPGVLCAVFSGLAAWCHLVPPYDSFALGWPNGFIAMGFYAFLVGLDLCLIHAMVRTPERLRGARARADGLVERQRAMFAELQHHVANNMQFVSSLLSLQKRRAAADPASAPAALDEAVERLRTMARVHRRLCDSPATKVGFGRHLQEICTYLLDATGARNVACRVEAPPTDLPLETLITLSLITTEAVTNSLKHAWPEGERGTIRVAIEPRSRAGSPSASATTAAACPRTATRPRATASACASSEAWCSNSAAIRPPRPTAAPRRAWCSRPEGRS